MFEIFYNFNGCLIIFLLFYVSKGEYRIKEGHVPVYLNYTFVNLAEDVFPRDLNISLSLSKMAVTLLYSVDNKNNQIIMSLSDADSPTLDVEINRNHIYISLIKICGCIRCRFEKISLRIQTKDVLYLSCNNEKIESYQFVRSNKMNKDYPIPAFTKSDKLQAYLWLVNTPEMHGNYPNSAQLSGCIFEVTYNKQPLKMGKYGTGDKCPITCTNNICNGGQCLETYNNYPVCNCTDSFMNGRFCNETLKQQLCNATKKFQFKEMKTSFQNVAGKIFNLYNNEYNLKLVGVEGRLFFVIEFDSMMNSMKYTLTRSYDMKETHIVVIQFRADSIHIKYRNQNTSWKDRTIPFHYDLSGSIFQRLKLDNNGLIDFRFKDDFKDITWKSPFDQNESMCNMSNTSKKFQPNISDEHQRRIPTNNENNKCLEKFLMILENLNTKVNWLIVIAISVLILGIVIVILIVIFAYKILHRNVLPDQSLVKTIKATILKMETDQTLVATNQATVLLTESDQTLVATNQATVLLTERLEQKEDNDILLSKAATI